MTDRNPRTVRLPSGQALDVYHLPDARLHRAPGHARSGGAPALLHICDRCASKLAQPIHWSETGPSRWRIRVRCPECGHTSDGVYDRATAERFDLELECGRRIVRRELEHAARENAAAEVERFRLALEDGHILPEDF